MSFKKKKRPYDRTLLASITIRVTREQKERLQALPNMSQYLREIITKEE